MYILIILLIIVIGYIPAIILFHYIKSYISYKIGLYQLEKKYGSMSSKSQRYRFPPVAFKDILLCFSNNREEKYHYLGISWNVFKDNVEDLTLRSISKDVTQYRQAPYTLQTNSVYRIVVSALNTANKQSSSATALVYVLRGNIVPVINGGAVGIIVPLILYSFNQGMSRSIFSLGHPFLPLVCSNTSMDGYNFATPWFVT